MKSILAGALGLVVLQVVIASPLTSGRLSTLGGDLRTVVSRFVDPTVALIGSAAVKTSAATASGPSYATYAASGLPLSATVTH